MNEEAMSAWIEENFKSNLDVIEDLSYAQIKQMVLDREYVLIYACKFSILKVEISAKISIDYFHLLLILWKFELKSY